MNFQFFTRFSSPDLTVPWRVWWGSRLTGLLFGVAIIVGLLMTSTPQMVPEVPVIESVFEARIENERPRPITPTAPKPVIAPKLPPPRAKLGETSKTPPLLQAQQKALAPDRPTPSPKPALAGATAPAPSLSQGFTPPRIATGPSSQAPGQAPGQAQGGPASLPSASGSTGQGMTASQGLSTSTIDILQARACARLDIRDRPANCPPNKELLEQLARARGPQYRPENAEAFSRNEQKWRDVPPPCLADGQAMKMKGAGACVRFGNVPSRVRTIKEICEAKGIGACAPPPGQAAVNAAIEQVRRQEAAKAGN